MSARHSASGRQSRGGSNAIVTGAVLALVAVSVAVVAVAVAIALRPRSPVTRSVPSADKAIVARPATGTAGTIGSPAPASGSATLPPAAPASSPATDQFVPVLMYHHVKPEPDNFIAISPETFENQLKWMADNGYRPVSIAQFTDFVRTGRRLPGKPVVITFDDGRRNQLDYAVPLLKKYGFTATFFVCKKWVENPGRTFMSAAELKKLSDEGFDIQSHTNSHTFIRKSRSEGYALMKKRLWGETNGARVWLERVTGKPVTALAYPGGAYDRLTSRLVAEAGYTTAFTCDTGFNYYHGQSDYMVRRYNAGARSTSWSYFVSIFTHKPRVGGSKG